MSNDYLQHYGVPGMKWGRRRVNSLGPPVIEIGPDGYRDAGSSNSNRSNNSTGSNSNKRYSSNSNTGSAKSKGNSSTQTNSSPTSNPKPFDVKGAQSGLKEGKKLADAGVKKLEADRQKETKKDLKSEARNMTDEDLRKVINRLSMEEKYVQAMEKEGYGKSKTDLQKTLELVGTAVSYADTALEVYDKIQKIRGR